MMADPDLSTPHLTRHQRPRAEFRIYFALIFVLALPFAIAQWVLALVSGTDSGANPGIVHRALREARVITPMIFSA
jgi:hypothetical protein